MKKLLIRHLPNCFLPEDTIKFLNEFGAIDVVTFPVRGKMRNCAFATFADESSTLNALRKLHQFELNGTKLVVEFSKDSVQASEEKSPKEFDKNKFFSNLPSIIAKLNNNSTHPKNSEHECSLTCKNSSTFIINDIVNNLLKNPIFYSQVIDLMKEMKLPSSLEDSTLHNQKASHNAFIESVEHHEKMIEDESVENTIESDISTEIKQFDKLKKRKIIDLIQEASKKLKSKNESIVSNSASNNDLKMLAEYFDDYIELRCNRIVNKVNLEERMETEIYKSKCQQRRNDCFSEFTNEGKTNESCEQDETQIGLETNRPTDCLPYKQLTIDELKNNPVFNNYSIGEPNSRLYLKNLDKKITEEQLKKIYMDFLNLNTKSDIKAFNVTLLKKGKMNGQAFISLANEQLAKLAIEKTNGLLINRKPICVSFARPIKDKK